MDTYCLLQSELGPGPDIADLEAAAATTASLTRLDCINIHRDIHGVVLAGLEHADALSCQAVLAARGHATRVLADAELPVLHASRQIQRIDHADRVLVLTDSMGREWRRPLEELVFLAAGFHGKVEFKHSLELRTEPTHDYNSHPHVVAVRKGWEETEQWFRLDLFFCTAVYRCNVALTPESAIFYQSRRLTLQDRPGLTAMMVEMATLLPPERLNSQLRDPDQIIQFRNIHPYESEIRWHFERLA